MGSMGEKVNREANTSTKMEVAAMAYREEISTLPPKNFHPSRNRGMLATSTTVPMGMEGTRKFTIWPKAVMPPRPMLLGTYNQSKPRANTIENRVIRP